MEKEIKIGDIIYYDESNPKFYEQYSSWCISNNAHLEEIGTITKETKIKDSLATEIRTEMKTFRQFQVVGNVEFVKTQEDVELDKQHAYANLTDPLVTEYMRKSLLGTLTPEREAEIKEELAKRTEEIKSQNPDL